MLDLVLQIIRQQVKLLILLREQGVKLIIEHPDDLAGLVAHDLLLLLVVERRYRKAACIIFFCVKIDVSEMSKTVVQWIWRYVVAGLVLILRGKTPSCVSSMT